eukprot:TRINITY_DN3064_c0_g1_i4.p1 TRINITY_DN3064_c0_g1~~TRINITY_DN3064_c0_g1_i4.p1  ORF type:complete len:173 (+),score=20.81 TRINITY_DN3064_c0_g1_i4:96-614(+)
MDPNFGLFHVISQLEQAGIKSFFPIQIQSIPLALENHDIVGQSPTGSGKTLAFAVPIVEKLLKKQAKKIAKGSKIKVSKYPTVMVVAPTRELAKQIHEEFTMLAAGRLLCACVYGGVSVDEQKDILKTGVDIVCGTPGRVIDLIEQRALKLKKVKYLVSELFNIFFCQMCNI